MNSFRRHRQSWALLGPPSLTLFLGLLGVAATACKKAEQAEPASEVKPAATAAEAATAAPSAAATPSPGVEITITGFIPPQWDPQEQTIGPGDTVEWKVGNGPHGLRFPVKADCDLALATMTFDPPLDPIAGGGCQSKKASAGVIVTAHVTAALTRDLPYDCVVHKTLMPGTLKPK